MSDQSEPRRPDLIDLVAQLEARGPGASVDEPEPERVAVPIAERTWARIPKKFREAHLADFGGEDGDIRAALNDWSVKPAGRNLVLLGPVGVGKSHAAVAACRHSHFVEGLGLDFEPVSELLDKMRVGGTEGAIERAMNVDLLILDEIGAERPTDWTAERLYIIVNRRWMEERPTIATSNLPGTRKSVPKDYEGETLEEAIGPRMFSRLVGGAVVVRLSGADRRRTRR